jgi:hypothetical protein
MTGVGTSHLYAAPELFNPQYDQTVDVFSYAMILWEIATGRSVITGFPGGTDPGPVAHLRRVAGGARPTAALGALADGIVDCLWQTNPADRMSFADFLDYAKGNGYELFEGANKDIVAEYVARLEAFEAKYPAPDLREYEGDAPAF